MKSLKAKLKIFGYNIHNVSDNTILVNHPNTYSSGVNTSLVRGTDGITLYMNNVDIYNLNSGKTDIIRLEKLVYEIKSKTSIGIANEKVYVLDSDLTILKELERVKDGVNEGRVETICGRYIILSDRHKYGHLLYDWENQMLINVDRREYNLVLCWDKLALQPNTNNSARTLDTIIFDEKGEMHRVDKGAECIYTKISNNHGKIVGNIYMKSDDEWEIRRQYQDGKVIDITLPLTVIIDDYSDMRLNQLKKDEFF